MYIINSAGLDKKTPSKCDGVLAGDEGFARLRAEQWSALTATGSHSLPPLQILLLSQCNKKDRQKRSFLLAGDEGFEPSQTESESVVLPLHKSPIFGAPLSATVLIIAKPIDFVKYIFTKKQRNIQILFLFVLWHFLCSKPKEYARFLFQYGMQLYGCTYVML